MIHMTQSKTFQGIKFIMIALLLDLVMGVFGIITAISSFVGSEMGMGSGGGIMGSTPDTEAMMANLGLLCLVLLLTGLAFLGWLTLMIVGLVKIYQGRHEFDQEHSVLSLVKPRNYILKNLSMSRAFHKHPPTLLESVSF